MRILGSATTSTSSIRKSFHRLKVGLEKIKADENYNPTVLEQPKETLTIEQFERIIRQAKSRKTKVAGHADKRSGERSPPQVVFSQAERSGLHTRRRPCDVLAHALRR